MKYAPRIFLSMCFIAVVSLQAMEEKEKMFFVTSGEQLEMFVGKLVAYTSTIEWTTRHAYKLDESNLCYGYMPRAKTDWGYCKAYDLKRLIRSDANDVFAYTALTKDLLEKANLYMRVANDKESDAILQSIKDGKAMMKRIPIGQK